MAVAAVGANTLIESTPAITKNSARGFRLVFSLAERIIFIVDLHGDYALIKI